MAKTRIHFRPDGKLLDEVDYHREELKDQAEKVAQLLEAKLNMKKDRAIIGRIRTLRDIAATMLRIAADIHNDIRKDNNGR